ncbi:M23 family metallopeptidase [uncultured Tateyamaria sp.]|uniref:M23 family metallopeptidase n=1 Tax=uncultured Tateyamaria sp. TaxID=455651 RepID=UPI00260D9C17|nr:M23 family metallopeptidase [uncultured Tateyamaria sp.]
MRAAALLAAFTTLAAGPLAARDIILNPPIDCDLGSECFVQQYVDHDPSNQAMDFRCSSLSYDTHQGTDFALRSLDQMRRGVDVIAAAPGTVRATRDGMEDALFTPSRASQISGRECGNGVVVDHGGGWTTQYCHMKRGSIAVKQGERVRKSTPLGQVGLSGRTQFPHVHLTVRKDGKVVDPFDPDNKISCGAPSGTTLWQTELPYRPGGILTVGFSDRVPKFDQVKQGTAAETTLPTDAPALVVFGYAFGGKKGDRVRLVIDAPNGPMMDETVILDKNQAQFFRAVGKKRTALWTPGTYRGTVTLMRGNREINFETGSVVVR